MTIDHGDIMDTIVLRGGRVIDPSQGLDALKDVVIADGKIAAIIEPATQAAGRDIDVSGRIVSPGLVDIHVHLREPGFEYKETIATGAEAAVAGGITSVVAMPNTDPAPDSADAVRGFYKTAESAACHVYTTGTITRARKGDQLAEFVDLAAAGVVGFSDDGDPVSNTRTLLHAMVYARPIGLPVVAHCEVKDLAAGGHMHEGTVSAELGIDGIPDISESLDVTRHIELAKYAGCRLHICHVSAAATVEVIRRAKAEGVVDVTAETAPHYLALTDEAIRTYDTHAKMNPPLRTELDRRALIEALQDGTIDAIATDHAPHSPEEKNVEFDRAPFGVIGLETSLGVCWTELVVTGLLTPLQLIAKMSTNPARIHGLPAGSLVVGSPADVVVIDPERRWTVPSRFRSKSRNSPFVGRELVGRAVLTLVSGAVRWEAGG
jgi:dihydroorotase